MIFGFGFFVGISGTVIIMKYAQFLNSLCGALTQNWVQIFLGGAWGSVKTLRGLLDDRAPYREGMCPIWGRFVEKIGYAMCDDMRGARRGMRC